MTKSGWGGKRPGAGSGGPRPGAGRPRTRWAARVGDVFVMERQAPGELDPFHEPEIVTILSVSDNEIEFQVRESEDIITLTLPE